MRGAQGGGGTALPPAESNEQYLDPPCVVPQLGGGGTAPCVMLEWRKRVCDDRGWVSFWLLIEKYAWGDGIWRFSASCHAERKREQKATPSSSVARNQ